MSNHRSVYLRTTASYTDPSGMQRTNSGYKKTCHHWKHWANTWGMKFNPKKCYILRITRAKVSFNHCYILTGHILEQVQESPYLGVLISENLKLDKHFNKMIKLDLSLPAEEPEAVPRRPEEGGFPVTSKINTGIC